jgi:PIN domain nuclease of toxin-antitoxin system
MQTIFVADTHTVLWYLTADARLGSNAGAVIESPANQIVIPAIVIAESLYVIEHGKSSATTDQFWDFVLLSTNVSLYPLDLVVLKKTEALSAILEMHDRQIVATALVLQQSDVEAVVVTKDKNISASGLVKTIW